MVSYNDDFLHKLIPPIYGTLNLTLLSYFLLLTSKALKAYFDSRPAGLVRLSRTTVNNVWMVQEKLQI